MTAQDLAWTNRQNVGMDVGMDVDDDDAARHLRADCMPLDRSRVSPGAKREYNCPLPPDTGDCDGAKVG